MTPEEVTAQAVSSAVIWCTVIVAALVAFAVRSCNQAELACYQSHMTYANGRCYKPTESK